MPKGNKPSRTEKLAHLDAALTFVTSFGLAVDVGAHIGLWTRVMATRFDRVLAFEPLDTNYARLSQTVEGFGNVTLVHGALGDETRDVHLTFDERSRRGPSVGSHSKHFITKKTPPSSLDAGRVRMERLDDYNLEGLGFLKVDAEGADTLVLRGAEKTLQRCRPVVIVESLGRFEHRYRLAQGAPMTFLETLGAKRVAHMWRDYIYVFPN